jgi:hypothetical protein
VQRLNLLGSPSPTLRTPESFALAESPRYFEDAFGIQEYSERTSGPEDPDLSISDSPQSPVTSPLSSIEASSVMPVHTTGTAHVSEESPDLPGGHYCVGEELGSRMEDTVYDAGSLTHFTWNPDTQATMWEASSASKRHFGSYVDHVGCI